MKKLKIILSIFLILIIAAGGYVGNMLGVFNEGNYGEYSLKKTEANSDSPLNGKTIIFLGSSVTAGYGSLGVSFQQTMQQRICRSVLLKKVLMFSTNHIPLQVQLNL